MEFESKEGEAPSAIAAYGKSWVALKAYPGRLLLILFVFVLLQFPTNLSDSTGIPILSLLYQTFVIPPIGFGFGWLLLRAIRGEEPEVGDLFSLFRGNYLNAVGAGIVLPLVLLIAALPAIGFVLLTTLREEPNPLMIGVACALAAIPFFAAIRLGFVPYLLAEKELGPVEVMGESWTRTEPVQLQLLVVILIALPLLGLGLLLLFVGVFPALLLASLAQAAMFEMSPPPLEEEESSETSE